MTVGIIGLGLIGGSLAKAFQRDESVTVLGWDADHSIVEFAEIAQAIDGELTDEKLKGLDLLLLATYPEAVVEHMTRLAPLLDKTTLVIDCAGTKEKVCASVFPLAKQYGFSFLGGHPMAGTHFSGFKYSRADLFDGAPMVLVPPAFDDIRLLDRAKKLLEPVGFGRVSITSAQAHDKRIAFTSQMAHIISNAYIKSPTARQHDGFSAGSYKDLTRVAWLNPDMWAELFLENRENLLFELGTLIEDLTKYKDAIERNDFGPLRQLLDDGRLTDNQGRTVDFKNTIVIMTSNIGSSELIENMNQEGYIPEEVKEKVTGELKNYFRPEFLNRVDDIIVFSALTLEQVKKIIDLAFKGIEKRLADREMKLTMTDAAKELIAKESYDPQYGARPIKRYLQKHVENELASMIIRGDLLDGGSVTIDSDGTNLTFKA